MTQYRIPILTPQKAEEIYATKADLIAAVTGVDGGGAPGIWGAIIGSISDQTDLSTALSGKQNLLQAGSHITIDYTDPAYPVISSTAGGGGGGGEPAEREIHVESITPDIDSPGSAYFTPDLGAEYLLIDISTNATQPIRLRLYNSLEQADLDFERPKETPIDQTTDHGLMWEYYFTEATSRTLTPPVVGTANSPTPYMIVNYEAWSMSEPFNITFHYLKLAASGGGGGGSGGLDSVLAIDPVAQDKHAIFMPSEGTEAGEVNFLGSAGVITVYPHIPELLDIPGIIEDAEGTGEEPQFIPTGWSGILTQLDSAMGGFMTYAVTDFDPEESSGGGGLSFIGPGIDGFSLIGPGAMMELANTGDKVGYVTLAAGGEGGPFFPGSGDAEGIQGISMFIDPDTGDTDPRALYSFGPSGISITNLVEDQEFVFEAGGDGIGISGADGILEIHNEGIMGYGNTLAGITFYGWGDPDTGEGAGAITLNPNDGMGIVSSGPSGGYEMAFSPDIGIGIGIFGADGIGSEGSAMGVTLEGTLAFTVTDSDGMEVGSAWVSAPWSVPETSRTGAVDLGSITMTIAGTPVTVLSTRNNVTFHFLLTGDVVATLPDNEYNRITTITFVLKQDGTGGHSIIFPGAYTAGGVAYVPTAAPGAIDTITLNHDGVKWVLRTESQDESIPTGWEA